MHLAKVPNFVRRIMFELRLSQDILSTIDRFLTSVLSLSSPTAVSLLSTIPAVPAYGELTQVKKRARRTVGCVCVRGLDDRRDVRMRGPAIDDEETWDDQHSLFSILEAPNCHKKKITRAHDIVVTRVYTSSLSKFFSRASPKRIVFFLVCDLSERTDRTNNFVTDSHAHLSRVQKRCAKHLELVVQRHPCIADLRHTLVRTRVTYIYIICKISDERGFGARRAGKEIHDDGENSSRYEYVYSQISARRWGSYLPKSSERSKKSRVCVPGSTAGYFRGL